MEKFEKHKNFDGDQKKVPVIRDWVINQLKNCKVSDRVINDFKVIMEKALSHIYQYSYKNEKVKPVRIKVNVNHERITVYLRDLGTKFDFSTDYPQDIFETTDNETGSDSIRRLMDGVEYLPHKIGKEMKIWKDRMID